MNDLKNKTAVNTIWSMMDRFGQQLITLTVFVVLARILLVEDYALIGMLSIFVAFAVLLVDGGFTAALIREKVVEADDYSTLFIFNIGVALLLYAILFCTAPLIASFYEQPRLVCLARIVFLSLPINACGIVQAVTLSRAVNFKLPAIINFAALLISGSAAVIMAICGMGVWALAAQTLIYSVSRVSLLWLLHRWQLSFRFQWKRLVKYLSFTSHLLFTTLLNATFNNLYSLIIGKCFSANQMGYYTQANKFGEIPNNMLNGPIQGVALAAFSQVQEDEQRFMRASRKSIRTLSFMLLPVMLGLACVAQPMVLIFLGVKWESIVPFFQLICVANIFSALSNLNNTFLYIKGLSKIVLRLEIVKVALLILVLVFTLPHGIMAMLYGLIAARVICWVINGFFTGRKTNYMLRMQIKDILPYLVISSLMAVATYSWKFAVENMYLLLVLQVVTGALVYIIANEVLGSTVYREAKQMVLDIVLRKVKFKKK